MKLANVGLAGTILVLSAALSGCSEDPPPVVVKPRAAAPAPDAKNTSTSADTLAMQDSVDTADSEYEEEGEGAYEDEGPILSTYSPASESPALKPAAKRSMPGVASLPTSSKATDKAESSSNNNSSSDSGTTGGTIGGGMGVNGQVQPSPVVKPVSTPRATLIALAKPLTTHLLLSGLTSPNGSGQTLTYDAYFPTDYAKATSGPFVFVVHGGDWTDGAKEDVKSYAVALAQKGFVAIAPNYRLAPANPHPAQVDDLADVMDFIVANPDKLLTTGSKYGAVGIGAGGHLASLVALSPTASGALKCVANVFSQSDLTNLPALDSSIKQFLGDDYSPELLAQTSPSRLVAGRSGNPSFFLSHGTADPKVPYAQTAAFAAALTSGNLSATVKAVEGAGHGYSDAQTAEAAADIATFMASCLAIQ